MLSEKLVYLCQIKERHTSEVSNFRNRTVTVSLKSPTAFKKIYELFET
jgi:hypothetical protein